jgi:hypothetical protein
MLALNPKILNAFSTEGILNSTSAESGGLKMILDWEFSTRQTVWARP